MPLAYYPSTLVLVSDKFSLWLVVPTTFDSPTQCNTICNKQKNIARSQNAAQSKVFVAEKSFFVKKKSISEEEKNDEKKVWWKKMLIKKVFVKKKFLVKKVFVREKKF